MLLQPGGGSDFVSRLDEVGKAKPPLRSNARISTRQWRRSRRLRRPVDEFFDKVTVNTDDPALRENRLRLLSRIRAVMNQVADFSQIEG